MITAKWILPLGIIAHISRKIRRCNRNPFVISLIVLFMDSSFSLQDSLVVIIYLKPRPAAYLSRRFTKSVQFNGLLIIGFGYWSAYICLWVSVLLALHAQNRRNVRHAAAALCLGYAIHANCIIITVHAVVPNRACCDDYTTASTLLLLYRPRPTPTPNPTKPIPSRWGDRDREWARLA